MFLQEFPEQECEKVWEGIEFPAPAYVPVSELDSIPDIGIRRPVNEIVQRRCGPILGFDLFFSAA